MELKTRRQPLQASLSTSERCCDTRPSVTVSSAEGTARQRWLRSKDAARLTRLKGAEWTRQTTATSSTPAAASDTCARPSKPVSRLRGRWSLSAARRPGSTCPAAPGLPAGWDRGEGLPRRIHGIGLRRIPRRGGAAVRGGPRRRDDRLRRRERLPGRGGDDARAPGVAELQALVTG